MAASRWITAAGFTAVQRIVTAVTGGGDDRQRLHGPVIQRDLITVQVAIMRIPRHKGTQHRTVKVTTVV